MTINFDSMKATGLSKVDAYMFFKGYVQAVSDYGIWNNGRRHIGCLNTDINEVFSKVKKDFVNTYGDIEKNEDDWNGV